MCTKVFKSTKRFASCAFLSLAALAMSTTTAMAQAKKFTSGQPVVIKENNTWFLGKFVEYAVGNYWIEVKSTKTGDQVSVDERGTNLDANVLSLDDAKSQKIAYTDLNAGNTAAPPPKVDVPVPAPVHNAAPPANIAGNTPPAVNTATPPANVGKLQGGDLVFVKKNGKWERGQIRGLGSSGGKTTYHVQLFGGAVEPVDNADNIVTAAAGLKAGYYTKQYPSMTINAPSKAYATTGVSCSNFCVITYTGSFTPTPAAATLTGKPGTVWSGALTDAVVRVTNEVRQNPVALANELDNNLMKYCYDWDQMSDVLDAIAYLRKVKSVGPLTNSDAMSKVNSDYISWYKTSGTVPHQGPGGNQPWDRVKDYGAFTAGFGENMSGGGADAANINQLTAAQADEVARTVVYGLIIDAGAGNRATRGHRVTIYNGQSIKY